MNTKITEALLNGMGALIEKMENDGLPMSKASIMGNWVLLGNALLDKIKEEADKEKCEDEE